MIASQSGMIVNPLVNKSVTYDTQRDFTAITQVTSSPLVVAVNPSLPVNSIRDLIAAAKNNPGKLNFSTSGNGSLPHLATALFDALAGIDMVHIPYKSGGLSVQSVLAGDTQVTFATAPSVMPLVQAGRFARTRASRHVGARLDRESSGNGRSGPGELQPVDLVRVLRARRRAAEHREASVRRDSPGAEDAASRKCWRATVPRPSLRARPRISPHSCARRRSVYRSGDRESGGEIRVDRGSRL